MVWPWRSTETHSEMEIVWTEDNGDCLMICQKSCPLHFLGIKPEHQCESLLLVLYIDLRPGQTCHSKDGGSCIFRWPVMGRDCVGELGWQYGTGLKSYGTVTNWCTGRGWPVNFITVISTRWWSKHAIPKTAEVAYSIGQLWEEIEWV